MTRRLRTAATLDRFARSEAGGLSVFGLIMFTLLLAVGGFAVDLAHRYYAQTQLQIAADTTAHAALVHRRRATEEEAKLAALELLQGNMPGERFGTTVAPQDIAFGSWVVENGTRRFEPAPGARGGVFVRARRVNDRGNALRSVLLQMVGVPTLEVGAEAVFVTYQPICIEEGFVAEGRVDVQSNNNYLRGFCIHSNDHVRINQNNYFEEGTIVSMPDLDLLDIPNSGFERNEGLEAALREGWQDIRILRELDEVRAGLLNGDEEYRRSFIDQSHSTPLIMNLPSNNNTLEMSMLTPGRVHDIRCNNGNGRLNIPGDTVIHNVVIVTNCLVRIGQNGRLENASLFSTNTNRRAIVGASGTTFGADDNCAPGGGAQIVTLGGMDFPANLGIFGSQLIALGDVQFAARADGVQGASIIAGGVIDGTSNSTMARCNRGMEENFTSPYYRLAL